MGCAVGLPVVGRAGAALQRKRVKSLDGNSLRRGCEVNMHSFA
jgi:hypothetical protein